MLISSLTYNELINYHYLVILLSLLSNQCWSLTLPSMFSKTVVLHSGGGPFKPLLLQCCLNNPTEWSAPSWRGPSAGVMSKYFINYSIDPVNEQVRHWFKTNRLNTCIKNLVLHLVEVVGATHVLVSTGIQTNLLVLPWDCTVLVSPWTAESVRMKQPGYQKFFLAHNKEKPLYAMQNSCHIRSISLFYFTQTMDKNIV